MRQRLAAGAAVIALAFGNAAAGEPSRTALPIPPPAFAGVIAEDVAQSTPQPPSPVRAPAGAPNILVFMADDVGFAMSSTFGGPVPTPNMDRLAAAGQRYNRFHTTAICSPSRAALLTGRNPHNAATGMLADLPMGYPGYDARIPPSTATMAQVLRLNGYATAMFGKHHNIPPGEASQAGPFDRWPTGLGFEYFFGIVQGETDQWRPELYRGTSLLPPADGPPQVLDKRLADDAVGWLHTHEAAAPDRPFFIYYAPASTHAPHQAPPEWIARFKGRFDQGWDKVREETWRRQLAAGVIPKGTRLTPRPEQIPAWSSLSPARRAFAARAMEVAAGMLAYQDAQFGRVLAELERMGQLDNTLVLVIQGDNGASGEGGVAGNMLMLGKINGVSEDEGWLLSNLNKLGGEASNGNYPLGWAWAMDTPFRWTKQYASMLGGIRNGMIAAWPGHVARPGSVCAQFAHLIDIAPTVYEAAHVPAPTSVYGVAQKPIDGQSLLPSLGHCEPRKPRKQYFELVGKAALYKDGWFASNDDGRMPSDMEPPGGPNPPTHWTLYDLEADFSQSTDLAARQPQRLAEMVRTWNDAARRNNVFPINHRQIGLRGIPPAGRRRFDLWGKDASTPAHPDGLFGRNPFANAFVLDADVRLDSDHASGVVAAVGSHFGGWSLYLDAGRPTFVYARSTQPADIVRISAPAPLPAGDARLGVTFTSEGVFKPARVELTANGRPIASARIERTFAMPLSTGEMFDAGRDTGVPVTDYATPHGVLEGEIRHVGLEAR